MSLLKIADYLKYKGDLEGLQDDPFNFKVNEYSLPNAHIATINYHQFKSPKFSPMTREARGLILDLDSLEPIALPFYRFYNFGECNHSSKYIPHLMNQALVNEKLDGSLVTLYNLNGDWHVATRGMAFAEGAIASGQMTFAELFWELFNGRANRFLQNEADPNLNYVFEIVSPSNRVITPYDESVLYLIAVRDRRDMREFFPSELDKFAHTMRAAGANVKRPAIYSVKKYEKLQSMLANLPPLEEGYVCQWHVGNRRFYRLKLKNPSYVAIANLKNNGVFSPERITHLVRSGEYREYLTYFPEHEDIFEPYIEAYMQAFSDARHAWADYGDLETRKEFALSVKDMPVSSVLFSMRDGDTIVEAFKSLSNKKLSYILKDYITS